MSCHARGQLCVSICVLFVVLFSKNVSCTTDEEVSGFNKPKLNEQWDNSQIAATLLNQADKRGSWKNFQGSWGKREDNEQLQNPEDGETFKRGGWSNLHGTWGKRGSEYYPEIENIIRKLYDSYRREEDDDDSIESYGIHPLKRSWTNFAGTWGKRPYTGNTRNISPRSTNWSSLRGSWGKRAADWSALRGAWGKRSTT